MDKPMTEEPVRPAEAGQSARADAPGLVAVQGRQRMRDGTELLLRTWEPDPRTCPEPPGCVLLVHGLAEHSGRYQHVAEVLCGLGLRVRAYDQRGHGASGGARMVAEHPDAYLDDLAEIHDATVRAWNELPILLGHSMGGLVAARFATLRVRPVRALVLSSPALALRLSPAMLTLHRVLLTLAPRLRVPNPIDARMLSHDPQVVARYRADPLVQTTISASVLESFIRGMAQAQADAARLEAPMLMLVGGADRIVDPAGSRTFFDHAPADLRDEVWFDQGYHEIFNEAEPVRSEVFAALTDWLSRHLAPPQH
jgi:lysophospholipase